jgi:sec-independent protein translocase protein TatC
MIGEPVARSGPPEQLPRMSFGDHLDELRRRVIRALLAIVVAVLALAPLKQQITAIYVAPYRTMWLTAYDDYVARLEAEHAAEAAELAALRAQAEPGRAPPAGLARLEQTHERRSSMLAWNRDHRAAVRAGEYEFHDDIRWFGGFEVPYTLVAIGGLDDFWTFMAATFLFGLILASPIVLWQAWAFIAAGLYSNERRIVMRVVPFAFLLLAAGVLFGFLFVVPYGLFFLVKLMNWAAITPMFSVSLYFSFLLTLTAALGLVFQTPLVMLALDRTGIVPHESMRKNWRYVILVIFVVAAVLTPPDPFTMMLMALPMTLLYGVGLLLTARRSRPAPALAASTSS